VFLQSLHVPGINCPKIAERDIFLLTLRHEINVLVITVVHRAVEALARNWAGEDLSPSSRSMKIAATVFR